MDEEAQRTMQFIIEQQAQLTIKVDKLAEKVDKLAESQMRSGAQTEKMNSRLGRVEEAFVNPRPTCSESQAREQTLRQKPRRIPMKG